MIYLMLQMLPNQVDIMLPRSIFIRGEENFRSCLSELSKWVTFRGQIGNQYEYIKNAF